jgi:hypothetical protein
VVRELPLDAAVKPTTRSFGRLGRLTSLFSFPRPTQVCAVLNDTKFLVAAWVCVAAVAGCTVWELTRADWSGVLFLFAFLDAAVLFIVQRRRLPAVFSFLFALAALVNGLGWGLDFWDRVPGWDPLAHGYTTFAGALAVGFLVFHSSAVHFQDHRWS